jgi:hypothetical protein
VLFECVLWLFKCFYWCIFALHFLLLFSFFFPILAISFIHLVGAIGDVGGFGIFCNEFVINRWFLQLGLCCVIYVIFHILWCICSRFFPLFCILLDKKSP